MPLDSHLLELLLHKEEGSALDFKREQYAFEGADNDAKSALLKDILAFANTRRQTTAYVLIGVEEIKGGRSKVIGVTAHLDDAQVHQFVNSKTQHPVEFSYQPLHTDDREIGVIEIPIQERPIYLTKQFGKLHANAVYMRYSSTTAVAAPDEIVQMGELRVSRGTPQLVLEWVELCNRTVLPSPCPVHSLILDPQLPASTFEESRSIPSPFDFRPSPDPQNEDYSQEVIFYTSAMAFLKPLGFRLRNQSAVVGKRVLFVGSVTGGDGTVVRDWDDRPTRPYRSRMGEINASMEAGASRLQSDRDPDPCVRNYGDRWEITIDFGDVRPSDDVWTNSPLLVGSRKSGNAKLEGELRGDNLPEPISCVLDICFEVERRPMQIADVIQYFGRSVLTAR